MASRTPPTRSATRLQDYVACLFAHNVYTFMWLAECAKQAGNWFTFLAAYAVIKQLSSADVALHTALFLICRRAPYLLLFPVTGLAADRLNRGALLVAVCLVQGAVSFSLPIVQMRGDVNLLYPLILLQYSAQAFYDPARIAAIPTVIPPALLCVAGTLDLCGFSLMALFGAAMAGHTAAVYGTATCFRIEGCTFLTAAALMLRLALPRKEAGPGAANGANTGKDVSKVHAAAGLRNQTSAGGATVATATVANGGADVRPELQPLLPVDDAELQPPAAAVVVVDDPRASSTTEATRSAGVAMSSGGGPNRALQNGVGQVNIVADVGTDVGRRGRGRGRRRGGGGGRRGGGGCGGCGALRFLSRRGNWDVAALIWAKATGAMVWGAVDVLNGRFSQMPSMQALGGPDQTLGLILVAVGLGSVVGPFAANGLTPGVARFWRVSIAVAFLLLAAGYSLMAAARNLYWVLPATVVRTSGSATIWVHSMAIMQHRLHEGIRGRLVALEFVLYTVSEAGSTLFGGYAMDTLGWSTRHLSLALAALAVVLSAAWGVNAWLQWNGPSTYLDGDNDFGEDGGEDEEQEQEADGVERSFREPLLPAPPAPGVEPVLGDSGGLDP